MGTLELEGPLPSPPELGYVEVMSRSGAVVRRIPLTSGAVLQLGRHFANDIVLDDPYVCPCHARLIFDGEGRLRIEDLSSVNGIWRSSGGARQTQVTLAAGESVRIGRTLVRFRASNQPLEPTLVDRSATGLPQVFEHPVAVGGLCLLTVIGLLLQAYLSSVTRTEGVKLVLEPLATLVLVAFWGALWAFASRLLAHRWNFWIHVAIGSAGILGYTVLEPLTDYLCFALNLDAFRAVMAQIGHTFGFGLLLYAHLRFVSGQPPLSLVRTATATVLTILTLTLLTEKGREGDFDPNPVFEATLKAPVFKLSGSRSAQDFFVKAAQLTDRLDRDEVDAR